MIGLKYADMDSVTKIQQVFKKIAPEVINLVNKNFDQTRISINKGHITDYATETDIASEKVIINIIKEYFPNDEIMAEESYNGTTLNFKNRTWVIDPICGTNNLMRGTRFFCSNIAVFENQKLIASCVVDHSKQNYIWSTGNKQVFVNDQLFVKVKKDDGWKIDIDFGSVFKINQEDKKKYTDFISKLVLEDVVMPVSMNSSLGFAYVAIGINDGFYCVRPKLWDVAAAVFLIQQSGGVVTDSNGQEWTHQSVDIVATRSHEIQNRLISLLK
jgi:myo-inositol-1(or 4)-monophosphatase